MKTRYGYSVLTPWMASLLAGLLSQPEGAQPTQQFESHCYELPLCEASEHGGPVLLPLSAGAPGVHGVVASVSFRVWVLGNYSCGGSVFVGHDRAVASPDLGPDPGPALAWLPNGVLVSIADDGIIPLAHYPAHTWQQVTLWIDHASGTYDVESQVAGEETTLFTDLSFHTPTAPLHLPRLPDGGTARTCIDNIVIELGHQRCKADCNADGMLDTLDYVCFQTAWLQNDPIADCNEDGVVDLIDFIVFQQLFDSGCS